MNLMNEEQWEIAASNKNRQRGQFEGKKTLKNTRRIVFLIILPILIVLN